MKPGSKWYRFRYLIFVVVFVILFAIVNGTTKDENQSKTVSGGSKDVVASVSDSQSIQSSDSLIIYTFRSEESRSEHYEKHGKEMGYASAEEYEAAASAVVTNPNALHKLEAEDGDDVYYLEETNEFVIVSTTGYIRTYFLPDRGIDYFNEQ